MNVEQEQQQRWQPHEPRICEVTAGLPSKLTCEVYQRYLWSLVLLDFSPKVIKQRISDYLLYLQEKRNVKRESIMVQVAHTAFFRNNNDEFHQTTHHFQRDLPPDESKVAHGDDRSSYSPVWKFTNEIITFIDVGGSWYRNQETLLHAYRFCRTGGLHDSCLGCINNLTRMCLIVST